MTRSLNSLALLVLLAVATLSLSRADTLAVSCNDVTAAVAPCLLFLKGSSDAPSEACCEGVKNLAKQANSQSDREGICGCLKSALSRIGSYNPSLVPQVTAKCGVAMTIPPIDQNTDCSKA